MTTGSFFHLLPTQLRLVAEPPPSELADQGSPGLWDLLPTFGIGTIIGAFITASVLYGLENKRQNGENRRKALELRRIDERQWNQEIREAFVKARAQLNKLNLTVSRTRLFSNVSIDERELLRLYQDALAVQTELEAITDGLRVIAGDDLIATFREAVATASDFLGQWTVKDNRIVTYTRETANATKKPDFKAIEEKMLQAVKKALKTLDEL